MIFTRLVNVIVIGVTTTFITTIAKIEFEIILCQFEAILVTVPILWQKIGTIICALSYPLERPESADLALNDLLDRPEPTLEWPESALERPDSALDRLESKRFLGDVLFLL